MKKKVVFIVIIVCFMSVGYCFDSGFTEIKKNKVSHKIDGKYMQSKSGKKYYNYTIMDVSYKGILIKHKHGKTMLSFKNCPENLKNKIKDRLYIDDNFKLYDMKSYTRRGFLEVGMYKVYRGTLERYGNDARFILKDRITFRIINTSKYNIVYDRRSEIPLVVVGKPRRNYFTAELLSKPTKEQFKLFFAGKRMGRSSSNIDDKILKQELKK